jgi:oligopeptide transport system substrate-binding protein
LRRQADILDSVDHVESIPQTLRLVSSEPESIDPAFFTDFSAEIIDQLFSGLVELTPELDIVPDVARSWQVLDGGRRYLFNLRQDVTWSDGLPVTAVDFEYAWKRALDPATRAHVVEPLYGIKGARAYHLGETGDASTVGVRAIDDWTLEVQAEQPAGHFLNILNYPSTKPVPRHIVTTYGEAWTAVGKIVSNGPFQLVAWKPGQSIELKRSTNYHGRFTGNVERIISMFDSESKTSATRYHDSQVDIVRLNLQSAAVIQELTQKYPAEYFSVPRFVTIYLSFDHRRPPFNDRRVRQALAHAIDLETLADVAYGGQVDPARGGFVPPGMPGHTAGIAHAYDPDKARRLLAEAGFPDGNDFPVKECLLLRGEPLIPASYLREQLLEELGIEIGFRPLPHDERLRLLQTNQPQMQIEGWAADFPDPYTFLGPSFLTLGYGWKDAAFEQLIEEASGMMDQKQRIRLYRQADRILIEQAVIVPLIYDRYRHMLKPWVRRYPVSGMSDFHWKDVIIDPH